MFVFNDGYIEYVNLLFFRNKVCYIIGCCIVKNGDNMLFVIVLLNSEKGLYIDVVMMGVD